MSSPDSQFCHKAMEEQQGSLEEQNVSKLVKIPDARKEIKTIWVSNMKLEGNERPIRSKASLVAK